MFNTTVLHIVTLLHVSSCFFILAVLHNTTKQSTLVATLMTLDDRCLGLNFSGTLHFPSLDPVQQSQVAITFGAMHVLHSSALRIIVRFITHQKLVLSSADLAELALIRFLESVQKLRVVSCDLTNGICWTMSMSYSIQY